MNTPEQLQTDANLILDAIRGQHGFLSQKLESEPGLLPELLALQTASFIALSKTDKVISDPQQRQAMAIMSQLAWVDLFFERHPELISELYGQQIFAQDVVDNAIAEAQA